MSTRGNDTRTRATTVRGHGIRALTAGAALCGTLLAVTGPAHAATNVAVAGAVLEINAGNMGDAITVSVDVDGSLLVTNTGDTVVAGAQCVAVTANQVDCASAGVARIRAAMNSGDDVLRNQTSLRARADMGAGTDWFEGGSAVDTVDGNDGNDTLLGGDGNDRLFGNSEDDFLVGEGGDDDADGGSDIDLCDAESEINCEL
ncbi:hypothetical protein [Nonomuraea sp. KM90]|uniref:hypothetical protein n=1 Tax=Nonomuraea sp. KM90 TaxID=3457428 RepID=UPI003FCDF192